MDPSYYDAQKNLYKLSPSSLPTTFQLADGTAANPSLKFILDPDTGLYRPSNNTLGITTGGTERVRISDTGLQSAYDIQGLTFKFDADNTNYLDYDSGGNRIRHIINGISKFSVSDTLTGSINPIHIPAGTLSDLALAFITDPDTGLYVPGANQLGFAAGGSNALTLSSSLALFASEPRADKFSFSDSITSYLEFENVGLSIDLYNASNLKLRIASAYSEHYNVFRNALGTAANTSYSFYDYDQNGYPINKFLTSKNSLLRLTNIGLNISANFKGEKKQKSKTQKEENNEINDVEKSYYGLYDNSEINFDIPWNLSISYDYNFNKSNPYRTFKTSNLRASLGFSLTEKWRIDFSGYYDLVAKKLLAPQLRIQRDLHCWVMNFSWVPIGKYSMFNFEIRIKAPQLSDIKLIKQGSTRGVFD